MRFAINRLAATISRALAGAVGRWQSLVLAVRGPAKLVLELPSEPAQRASWEAAIKLLDAGDAHREAKQLDRAWEAYQRARAAFEGIAEGCDEASGETPALQMYLSSTLGRLGEIGQPLGHTREVVDCYSTMVDVDRKILERVTDRIHAVRLSEFGDRLREMGRLARACDTYSWAKAVFEGIITRTGATPEARRDLSICLGRLGDVERAHRHLAAAASHYEEQHAIFRQMLELVGETPEALRDVSGSLGRLGDVELARGDSAAAAARYEQQVDIDRRIVGRVGETPDVLRNLSGNLERLGEVERSRGDLAAATAHCEEALAIDRKLLEREGETPLTWPRLPAFCVSLERLGDVERARGDLAAATARYEEALAINRQLLERLGETPDLLRNLGATLERLGNLERERGDLAEARVRYEEQHEIAHRILELVGETPQALLDVRKSLERLGDLERVRGNLAEATALYEQHHEIARRIIERQGETPQALRGMSLSLWRLGDMAMAHSDLPAASAHYTQLERVARQIVEREGETPEALRVLSLSLEWLGDVERARGDLTAATARYEQQHEVDRRIIKRVGDTSDGQRALVRSLGRLGDLAHERGDLPSAASRYEQLHEIARRVLERWGDTPEALLDLSVSLSRLGDVERARGDLAAATARYEQQHAIALRIVECAGETAEALQHLSLSLERLGDVERERGDLAAATGRYEGALAIDRQRLKCVGERPEALRSLSMRLMRLGDVEFARGNLAAAAGHYEQEHKIACRILDRLGETPEALRDLSAGLMRLGDVDGARGDLAAATARYEKLSEINLRIIERVGETPENLRAWVRTIGRLGEVDEARGNLAAAHVRYKYMAYVAVRTLELAGETPEDLQDVSASLGHLGNVEYALGDLVGATECYEQQHDIARRLLARVGETPGALRHLGLTLGQLGDVERARGDLAGATARYEQEYEITRRILERVGETPQALRDVSASLRRLGDVDLARNDLVAASGRAIEQFDRLLRINTQWTTWPGDAALLAVRLLTLASAGALPVAEALSQRAELWKRLYEHIDLADTPVLQLAQPEVARFHASWLRLALERAPDRLPEVLAAMQGRKIAALVLEELEQQRPPSGASSELYERFKRLRAELRRQALNLRVISGGAAGRFREDDPHDRAEGGLSVSAEVWRAREAEYRATRAEYQACLGELAKQPGYEALQPPQMDAAELRPTLADGQALLIVVQPPGEGQVKSTPQALLLRRDGHQLVPLPGLHATIARVRSLADASQQVVGKRYAGSRRFDSGSSAQVIGEATAEPVSEALDLADSEALSASAGEAFWAPLAPHLQGLHTLHVVTHGELHMLPLAHEGPGGIHLYQYPGLVFYWLQHQASEPHTAEAGLALQVHSPAQGEVPPPIPFVHAEAQLARSLWSPVYSPLPLQQEASPRVVHLAGHGEAGRGQDAALLIGPQQTLSLHELLLSRLRPEIVYLSACLVGRTSEDLDGDPLGMVSAFFLRGARSVVAPLVPISDLYAPILAGLFHWELKRQDDAGKALDASRALQRAKAGLSSGEWPAEIVQRVREAYAGIFKDEIAEILHGRLRGVDGRQFDTHWALTVAVRKWMLDIYDVGVLGGLRGQIDKICNQQGPDAAATWGAARLAHMLVDARGRLGQQSGVQELLRYMQVYGAPQRRAGEAAATTVF